MIPRTSVIRTPINVYVKLRSYLVEFYGNKIFPCVFFNVFDILYYTKIIFFVTKKTIKQNDLKFKKLRMKVFFFF